MNTTPNESDNASSVRQVSSVAEFTEWVDKLGSGNILFRGLANVEWGVESSLHRRLKYNKLKAVDHSIYHNIFMEMVKILISRSRRNGHDIENGRELKDLELLAKLQHYGAATCLIDFTKNSLVALYFACASVDNENDNNANGKVVAFNSDNAEYGEISIKDFDKEIEHWFKEYEQNKKLWILSPKKLGNRIISQQSVFVFGSPTLPTEKKFHICKIENKKEIMKELKKYGISEETLFDDFVGFSAQNSYNKEYENWDTDSYFMSGLICNVTRDYESAIKYYDKEIISNLQNWVAYINRGLAKYNLGNFQNAIDDYDEAIKLNPKSYEAYNNRGLAKYNLREFQDAIRDHNETIRLNPESYEAYTNRGLAKIQLSEFQDAVSDFNEAIRLNHKDYQAYYNRGVANGNLGKIPEAINDYDKVIKLNPKFYEAYNNRGLAKGGLSKFQDAISDFNEAIRLNYKYYQAYHNRGFAKGSLGKFQESISDFNESIKLNHEYYQAYHNRGNAKNKLGDFQDAISDYNKAIRLNPKYWEAYHNRGLAKNKLGDIEGAAVDLAKAKEIKLEIKNLPPDNPNNNY